MHLSLQSSTADGGQQPLRAKSVVKPILTLEAPTIHTQLDRCKLDLLLACSGWVEHHATLCAHPISDEALPRGPAAAQMLQLRLREIAHLPLLLLHRCTKGQLL